MSSSCKTTTIYTSKVLTTYATSYTSALTTVTPPPTTTTYTTSTCPVSTYYSYNTGSYYTSSSAYATSYYCTPQYITTYVNGTPYTTYTTIPTTYYQTTTIPTYYPTTTCEYVYSTSSYPTSSYPTTSIYETIGRRADMGDSDYVSPISSKCLSIAVLFGGLVFAVVLASLVYHLLFKKWAKRGENMGTLYGARSQLHYAESMDGEEQHHALLHDEKGFKYEGHYLPHAGSTEYGVEACMPYNDVHGPLDKKVLGKKKEPISPSVCRD